MGEVSVQVTEPRRRPFRRPGPSQIKMYGFCRLFRAMMHINAACFQTRWKWAFGGSKIEPRSLYPSVVRCNVFRTETRTAKTTLLCESMFRQVWVLWKIPLWGQILRWLGLSHFTRVLWRTCWSFLPYKHTIRLMRKGPYNVKVFKHKFLPQLHSRDDQELNKINRPYFSRPRKYRRLLSEPTYWPRRSRGQYGEGNNQAGIFEAEEGGRRRPRKISSLTTDLSFYSKSARRTPRVSV